MTGRSHDPTIWMWQEACAMLDRADRMHREFFRIVSDRRLQPTWEPPVDIVESGQEILIIVALPGVRPRDIDVRVEGDTLTILAQRSMPGGGAGADIRRLEIPYGRFERRIVLTEGALQLERRELLDGCLHLTFRKLA